MCGYDVVTLTGQRLVGIDLGVSGVDADVENQLGTAPVSAPDHRSCCLALGDVGDLSWQREDQMELLHRQQIICPRRHPITRGWSLTLQAMPVFATVVCDMLVIAFGASRHVPTARFCSASLNG